MNEAIANLALFGTILLPILAAEFWFFWWLLGPKKSTNNKGY